MSCAKIRYKDRIAAALALEATKDKGNVHFYRCFNCWGFHLTSAPKRPR